MQQPIDVDAVEVADNPATEVPLKALDTSSELAKFDPIQVRLNDLKSQIATTVYDITTKDGEDTARMLRGLCVKVRTDADKAYKVLNAPLLAAQRSMRSLVEKIETEVKPLESRLDFEIKAKEKEIEDARQRKIAFEELRIKALRAKITAIAGLPARAVSMTLEQLQAAHTDLLLTVCDETGFGEFMDEAVDLVGIISEQLAGMLTAMEVRAAEAKRLADEAESLRMQREADALDAKLTRDILDISTMPVLALPKTASEISAYYDQLVAPKFDHFGDRWPEAKLAYAHALSAIRAIHTGKVAAEKAAEDFLLSTQQAEQRRQQDSADAERRQDEAAASTKLLKQQQDAFEAEQIVAKAKVQAERDALAVEKAEIAAMAAALAAPEVIAPASTQESEVFVARVSVNEAGLFEPEELPLTSSFNTCVEVPVILGSVNPSNDAYCVVKAIMSSFHGSELAVLNILLDARVQWAWTERRVELESNLSEIPS